VKVTALLADAAQVAQGKLYVLGGGWSFTGAPSAPMGLAILIEVPWNDTNRPHDLRIELKDADEKAVSGPDGKPIEMIGTLEVGRPPGHPQGEPLNAPFAVNFGPLPLKAGQHYSWVVTVDGDTSAKVGFNTRTA
jgi:hypothetical protein